MLPAFTENGLLPPGVHRATLEEFEQRFVYFDKTDRRFRLYESILELCQQTTGTGFVRRILFGGSFVSSKSEPNDFDCIVVLDPAIEGRELLPSEYNLVSRRAASRVFAGDVISVLDDSPFFHRYLQLFQSTRDEVKVGIVEIEL